MINWFINHHKISKHNDTKSHNVHHDGHFKCLFIYQGYSVIYLLHILALSLHINSIGWTKSSMTGARPLHKSIARSHLAWCPQHVFPWHESHCLLPLCVLWLTTSLLTFVCLTCATSLTPTVGSPHRGGAPELDKMLSGATIHPVTLGICLQCPKVFRNCFLFFTSLFHLIKNSSTLGNFVSPQICTMHDTL